ncbi:MAG TPA: ATP-binding protein [Vicinamibacterales bacterium]|nr:ATP-binding protein [Vicinamibacterales bacterium]
MPADHQLTGAVPRTNPSPWRYIYFLLAAFDIVTVSAGLYLNHRIMAIYLRSVEVNRIWADRAAAYSHLGELAGDVDAPGNDVFETRDVQKETIRMAAAVKAFDLALLQQRRELQANLDPAAAAPLLTLLDAIAVARTQMTAEAAQIFEYFRDGRGDLAGERMATMDHKYASLNDALLELRGAVGGIQQRNFTQQTAAAADLQRYEYAIGLSIVLMVLGATLYGHKVARQMQSDADERERHIEAVRAAELRVRSILDTAAEGIVSFDEQGRIESFNRAAEQLFGLEQAQAIGQDIRSMIPAIADFIDTNAAEAVGGERVGIRRDGTRFPLELSVSQVKRGHTRLVTAIVRDIGDRRRAEEALGVAAAAQAANRAKSQFLANMSHEIRTPMSGVLGMAELLLDTTLTPTQRRYAESVHRSGESLLGIIDGILDFSKIEAGKIELEHLAFSPRELIDDVVQLLRDGADKKGLEFVASVADDVPTRLRGAPSRLRQVLINLVGNAIKFTDRGVVALRVSRLDADADGAARSPGAGVVPDAAGGTVLYFAVADTGIGIAEAVQRRLFQPFEQGDSSTTRSYGGTGLGLAISRELLEKMGGRIGVRSAPGQGSEFWFTIRLDSASPPVAVSAPRAGVAAHALGVTGVRVLLAEDNPINQDVALAMLHSLGCHVHVVDSGVKVLAALGHSEFDIVLMDRQMPGMDGFDTTAEIRARRLLRPQQPRRVAEPVLLPVVGLTASALKGDRENCIAAGMDDYLAKPFTRDALRNILERWVLDHRAADAGPSEAGREKPLETFDRRTLDTMCANQRDAAGRIIGGLIDRYVIDAAGLIDTLARAVECSDASALAHAAHLLFVRSEFVGAARLADMSRTLEQAGLAGTTGGLAQPIASLRQEYAAVRVAMQLARQN